MVKHGLVILVLLSVLLPMTAVGDQGFQDLKDKRGTITTEIDQVKTQEQETLGQLFTLNRSLQQTREQIARTHQDIVQVETQQQDTEQQASALKDRYRQRLGVFGARVRFMVERGPSTYLEVIFASTDFHDFIQRLAVIQAFVRRDATLLSEVRSLRGQVGVKQAELATEHRQLAALGERLSGQQRELETTIGTRESTLAGLKDRRSYFETSLSDLEKAWSEKAVPLLQAFGRAFHTMTLHASELKPAQMEYSTFPVPSARITVTTDNLNNFIKSFDDLKGLSFDLHRDAANLHGDFGGVSLQIDGRFQIHSDTVLRYSPQQVVFQGLPIPTEYTQALIGGGGLDLDMATLNISSRWRLNEVKVDEGALSIKAGYKP